MADEPAPKKLPLIWAYEFDRIVGSAVVSDDGTVTGTITDQDLKDAILAENWRVIDGR